MINIKPKLIFIASIVFIGSFLIGHFIHQNISILKIYSCPISKQNGNANFFSQGLEDYILSIVLSDIKKGTYIDVGAYHPDIDSVTKYFYIRGWHGINIEPAKELYELFQKNRPLDININMGASNKAGKIKFHYIANSPGLSTFNHILAKNIKNHNLPYYTYFVPVTTLNHILTLYPLQHIDFIKIDVEGFERQVLEGLDLKKYRPKIFIIEALEPISLKSSYQLWEHILLNNNYEWVLSDGLNRYYLAKEHINLLKKFKKAYKCVRKLNNTAILK
ncbi:MAG: FkbM family methyltransferase [Gammaproteobacteria bacterium]|jgi:FkbM family methyltransferase